MLVLSALLASAIASAVASTASAFSTADNTVLIHDGATAASRKPNAELPVPPEVKRLTSLSMIGVISTVSVLAVAILANPILVGSSSISIGYCDMFLPSFYRKYVNMWTQIALSSCSAGL